MSLFDSSHDYNCINRVKERNAYFIKHTEIQQIYGTRTIVPLSIDIHLVIKFPD